MQSNLTLSVGFKGGQKMNGYAAYENNSGIRTVGGIISDDNTLDAEFGLVVFSDTDTPAEFIIGKSVSMTAAKYRGILLGNNGIRENMPARPNQYMKGGPATAANFGVLWFDELVREDGTTAPVIGDLLSVADATGILHTRTTTAGAGFTAIPGVVVEIIDGSYAVQLEGTL